jgi:hypothetical protein
LPIEFGPTEFGVVNTELLHSDCIGKIGLIFPAFGSACSIEETCIGDEIWGVLSFFDLWTTHQIARPTSASAIKPPIAPPIIAPRLTSFEAGAGEAEEEEEDDDEVDKVEETDWVDETAEPAV